MAAQLVSSEQSLEHLHVASIVGEGHAGIGNVQLIKMLQKPHNLCPISSKSRTVL